MEKFRKIYSYVDDVIEGYYLNFMKQIALVEK